MSLGVPGITVDQSGGKNLGLRNHLAWLTTSRGCRGRPRHGGLECAWGIWSDGWGTLKDLPVTCALIHPKYLLLGGGISNIFLIFYPQKWDLTTLSILTPENWLFWGPKHPCVIQVQTLPLEGPMVLRAWDEKGRSTHPWMVHFYGINLSGTSWWFQPIWKILVKIGIFPK